MEQKGVKLRAYECDVNGILGTRKGGNAIVRIVVHPKITVHHEADVENVNWAIERARRFCVTLNSTVATVVVEHKVEVDEDPA